MLNCKEMDFVPYIQMPANNTDSKKVYMNNTEIIVVPDECGDSLWDAVLEQEYPTLRFANIIF